MLKIFLLLFFIFSSTQLVAQGSVEFVDSDADAPDKIDINPNQEIDNEKAYYKKLSKKHKFKKVKDLNARAARSKKHTSIHSEAEKKNLEALLEQVRKENETVFKAFGDKKSKKKLQAAIERGDTDAIIKQMSQGDQQMLATHFWKKGESKKTMKKLLAPYRKMGYRQTHKFLRNKFAGGTLGDYGEKYPKLFDITAKLLVDKRALPNAVSIIEKRAQLALLIVINIAIFILSFVLARFKKKFPFFSFKRFLYFVFRFAFINGLRVGFVIYFFGEEIDPLFQIISASL